MRILLTGAFGFLAGRLANAWTERGHEVVLSDLSVPKDAIKWASRYEVRCADILDPGAVTTLVKDVEAVVNLASLNEHQAAASPDRALLVSGDGNRLLLEAASASDVRRFVFFSTFHVYGRGAPLHITEETPTRAAHPYSIAHLTGEGFCHQANVRAGRTWATAVRLSNGYGCPIRRDVDRWTLAHNDFCRAAVKYGKIVLNSAGTQERDFVWVEDVARAVDLVLTAPVEALGDGVFNLGGGQVLTIRELSEFVAARARIVLDREITMERPSAVGAEVSRGLRFDCSRLRRIGYTSSDGLVDETDRLLALLSE